MFTVKLQRHEYYRPTNRLKEEIDKIYNPYFLGRIIAVIANDEGSLMTDEQFSNRDGAQGRIFTRPVNCNTIRRI